MYIGTRIKTFLFGKFLGKDQYGNFYYRSYKVKNKIGKRWVIYKGNINASKIPPLWYRWLHHTTDKLPSEVDIETYKWQKPHKANYTGTKMAYNPEYDIKTKYYQAWKP